MKVEEQIQFNRLIDLRTRLDKLENWSVDQLLFIFFKAKEDLKQSLKKVKSPRTKKALRQIQKDLERSAETLSKLTTQNLNRNTAKMAGESLKGMDPIYSWDGKDVQYNTTLGLTDQVANTVQNLPIGGKHLAEWVDQTFDNTLALQRTILASQLQGEGYRKVVNSLMAVYPQTERELITLARSYLQESVVASQEALFEENDDIVKAVRWTAVMEIGFKSSGRGTCPRCAALDGTIYNKGDIRPPMTLHPRCRCMWSPITLSWDELFEKHRLKDKDGNPLTVPEMKQQNRKFVTRKESNINAGRAAGNVQGVERVAGDFEDYVNQPGKLGVMKSTFGPNRARLVKEGKVSVKDLVDRETGELFTLEQLGYPIEPKSPVRLKIKKPIRPKKTKPVVVPEAETIPKGVKILPGAKGNKLEAVYIEAIMKAPKHLIDDVVNAGYSFSLGGKVSEIMPELDGVRPRGWGNKTWDYADGFASHGGNRIIANTVRKRFGPNKKTDWVDVSEERFLYVFQHEFGHAIDVTRPGGRASGSKEFMTAYRKDRKGIPKEDKQYLGYFLQKGDAGPEESYAQAYSVVAGVPDPRFEASFKRVIKFVRGQVTL